MFSFVDTKRMNSIQYHSTQRSSLPCIRVSRSNLAGDVQNNKRRQSSIEMCGRKRTDADMHLTYGVIGENGRRSEPMYAERCDIVIGNTPVSTIFFIISAY